MKKITILLSVICTALFLLTLFEINAQKEQLRADVTEIIESKSLDERRKLLIYLPKDYALNSPKRYPVLYALDATSHDKDVLYAASILSLAEQIPEIIIVGIVNEDRAKDFTPNYIAMDQDSSDYGEGDEFLEFLDQEVIPLINKNYRTTNYKMISGNSRGGLFALFSMIEKPNLFNAYFCYSPAFWRSNNIIAKRLDEALSQNGGLDDFLFLSLGALENEKMKGGFEEVIEVLTKNDSSELKIFYEYTANADHGTNAYYSLPKALAIWSEQL